MRASPVTPSLFHSQTEVTDSGDIHISTPHDLITAFVKIKVYNDNNKSHNLALTSWFIFYIFFSFVCVLRWVVTPCYQFAGCPQRASCTGSSPQRVMYGASESFYGKFSLTANSRGSSSPIMRYTINKICSCIKCVLSNLWLFFIMSNQEVWRVQVNFFTIIQHQRCKTKLSLSPFLQHHINKKKQKQFYRV